MRAILEVVTNPHLADLAHSWLSNTISDANALIVVRSSLMIILAWVRGAGSWPIELIPIVECPYWAYVQWCRSIREHRVTPRHR